LLKCKRKQSSPKRAHLGYHGYIGVSTKKGSHLYRVKCWNEGCWRSRFLFVFGDLPYFYHCGSNYSFVQFIAFL